MVTISRAVLDELIAHATSEPHQEVCGVLGGQDGRITVVYRARNIAQTPKTRFDFHPRDFMEIGDAIDDAGMEIAGFYHSHINTSPYPSRTDVLNSNPEMYPDAVYLICSLKHQSPVVRGFRYDEDIHLVEEPIEVDE
jgi:proteasome lid subunit RPN8/RPN11